MSRPLASLLRAVLALSLLAALGYGLWRVDPWGGLTEVRGDDQARPATPSAPPPGAGGAPTRPSGEPSSEPTREPADAPPQAPADEPDEAPERPAEEAEQPVEEPALTPGPRLHGPGDRGREVRVLQARLRQIDWFQQDVTGFYGDATTEAVRGFQAKRGFPVTGEVDRRTLERLHEMTTEPTDAELANRLGANVPGALDPRCTTGRVLCADKSTRTLRWVVDGKVRRTFDVRFGGSATPTREGRFTVSYKSRDHVSSLYDTSMPFAMFFSGGQAVHYSPDFASVGYNGASHGCVNVRDREGIAWLFDQVRVGDAVVVYWS